MSKPLQRWMTFWNREGLLGPFRRRLAFAMLILAIVMGGWHVWNRISLAQQLDPMAHAQLREAAQLRGQNVENWPDSLYNAQLTDIREDIRISIVEPQRADSLRSIFVAIFLVLLCGGVIYADQRVANSIARQEPENSDDTTSESKPN